MAAIHAIGPPTAVAFIVAALSSTAREIPQSRDSESRFAELSGPLVEQVQG
jgi:hypothetical protein